MHKFYFFPILLIFVHCSVQNQVIHLNGSNVIINGRESGVILSDTITAKYSSLISKKQHIPTLQQINFFENYLQNDTIINEDEFFSKKSISVNSAAKFKNFKRQYSGYITHDGKIVIITNMLSFKNSKKAKKYFEGWKEKNFLFFTNPFIKGNLEEYVLEVILTHKPTVKILGASKYPKSNFLEN